VSAIPLLKWILISPNTEKLPPGSADMACRVHPNTSKFLMFGKESGSADTKDFIKVSGKSALSDCLDQILNRIPHYLMTSELACHHAMVKISLRGRIPSLTIKYGVRLSKALTGRLSAEKQFCNCYSKILIKGMPTDLL